jgi:hypothetical protein
MHLEYRLAFDLAWSYLAGDRRRPTPMLLVLSAPVFFDEAMARLDGRACVVTGSPAVTIRAMQMARQGLLKEEVTVRRVLGSDLREMTKNGFGSAVWACPPARTWTRQLETLDALLADSAVLVMLLHARSSPGLSRGDRWLTASRGGALPAPLATLGYRLVQQYPIGGPPSVLWAGLRRVASHLGRADLADSCEAGYRLGLATPVRPDLARLTVAICRKEGGTC